MPEVNAAEHITSWCERNNGSLNLRYDNGQWMAQLVKKDGSFALTAMDPNLNVIFKTLMVGIPG